MFNLVLEQPFFKSCNLVLAPWINFSYFLVSFMHTHLHYISQRFLNMGISLSFHLSLVHDREILWEECRLH